MQNLEYIKLKVDISNSIDENILNNTELLLKLYKKVLFRVKQKAAQLDEECYITDRKHLADLVDSLIDDDTQINKRKLEDGLISMDISLGLMEIMERALIRLKSYPDDGVVLFQILNYYYFDAYKNSHETVMELCNLTSATYYRKRGKAIRNYAVMLWGYTIPELKGANEYLLSGLEEVDSKLIVN